MAAGFACEDGAGSAQLARLQANRAWVQHVLDLSMAEAPGTRFVY